MLMALRIARGLFGVVAAFEALGVMRVISSIFEGNAGSSNLLGVLIAKIVIFAVFAGVFVGLRTLINHLYKKKFGEAHPALKNPLAL